MGRTSASFVRVIALSCVVSSALPASDAAADPVEPLGSLPRELEQGESANETWQLNTLGLVYGRHTKISLLGIPIVTADTWWPVRGKYRYDLSRQEFFLRAGRPDLASQQSARNTTSDLLTYGGLAVALGGIALPFLVQGDDGVDERGLLLGAVVFVGGVVASNVGTAMSGPVIERSEAEVLARRYNEALQHRVLSRSSLNRTSNSAPLGIPVARTWLGYTWRF